MIIQELPYELLEEIFKSVSSLSSRRGDVLNCALVCRSWYVPACHILYEKINVATFSPLLKCLASLEEDKGMFCKELEIMADSHSGKRPSEEYEQLFSYFPNLCKIALEYFSLRYYHLQQIAKHAVLLKHVKEISPVTCPWMPEESQDFYDCIFLFKNTLKRIQVLAMSTGIPSTDITYRSILSLVPDFTSLTSLEMINIEYNNPLNLSPLCMFTILRSCPNQVHYRLDNDFEETEHKHHFHQVDHSKLRCMDITVPTIDQGHMKYMVSNITRLKQLKIKVGYLYGPFDTSKPVQWLEEIGFECSNYLQKYFSSIEKVDFSMDHKFIMNSMEQWSFGNSVISNSKSTATHVSLVLANLIYHPEERKILLKKLANRISFYCGVDIKVLAPTDNNFNIPILLQTFITPTQVIADRIQSFHIEFKLNDEELTIMDDFRLCVFESIMIRFSNLYRFSMKIGLSPASNLQIKLSSDAFDREEDIDSPNTILPRRPIIESNKLAYVTLRNLQSTQEITSILQLLPNTKYLMLLGCYLTADVKYNYTLDMTHLYLDLLTLDITKLAIQGQGEKTFVLKIEQTKSNRTAYFKWKRVNKILAEMLFEPVDKKIITRQRRLLPSFNIITIKSQILKKITLCSKGGLVITALNPDTDI